MKYVIGLFLTALMSFAQANEHKFQIAQSDKNLAETVQRWAAQEEYDIYWKNDEKFDFFMYKWNTENIKNLFHNKNSINKRIN